MGELEMSRTRDLSPQTSFGTRWFISNRMLLVDMISILGHIFKM